MAKEMIDGDTTAQPATDQITDAEDQLAIDPTEGDTEGQVAADPTAPVDEPMIPKSRLDEISLKAQRAEAELEQLRQQNLLLQTVQQYAPQQQQPQQAVDDGWSDLEDDDYPSKAQVTKREQALLQQVRTEIAVNDFRSTNRDYDEVVGAVDHTTGQFKASPHLQAALTKNPAMNQLLSRQTDQLSAMRLAYQLADSERKIAELSATTQDTTNRQRNAQATVSAQTRPMPASAAGGGGDVNQNAAVQGMSDAEFDALDRQVMSGQFDQRR